MPSDGVASSPFSTESPDSASSMHDSYYIPTSDAASDPGLQPASDPSYLFDVPTPTSMLLHHDVPTSPNAVQTFSNMFGMNEGHGGNGTTSFESQVMSNEARSSLRRSVSHGSAPTLASGRNNLVARPGRVSRKSQQQQQANKLSLSAINESFVVHSKDMMGYPDDGSTALNAQQWSMPRSTPENFQFPQYYSIQPTEPMDNDHLGKGLNRLVSYSSSDMTVAGREDEIMGLAAAKLGSLNGIDFTRNTTHSNNTMYHPSVLGSVEEGVNHNTLTHTSETGTDLFPRPTFVDTLEAAVNQEANFSLDAEGESDLNLQAMFLNDLGGDPFQADGEDDMSNGMYLSPTMSNLGMENSSSNVSFSLSNSLQPRSPFTSVQHSDASNNHRLSVSHQNLHFHPQSYGGESRQQPETDQQQQMQHSSSFEQGLLHQPQHHSQPAIYQPFPIIPTPQHAYNFDILVDTGSHQTASEAVTAGYVARPQSQPPPHLLRRPSPAILNRSAPYPFHANSSLQHSRSRTRSVPAMQMHTPTPSVPNGNEATSMPPLGLHKERHLSRRASSQSVSRSATPSVSIDYSTLSGDNVGCEAEQPHHHHQITFSQHFGQADTYGLPTPPAQNIIGSMPVLWPVPGVRSLPGHHGAHTLQSLTPPTQLHTSLSNVGSGQATSPSQEDVSYPTSEQMQRQEATHLHPSHAHHMSIPPASQTFQNYTTTTSSRKRNASASARGSFSSAPSNTTPRSRTSLPPPPKSNFGNSSITSSTTSDLNLASPIESEIAPPTSNHVQIDTLIRQHDALVQQVAEAQRARRKEELETGQMIETLNRLMGVHGI